MGLCGASTLALILLGAPEALSIAADLNPSLTASLTGRTSQSARKRPYDLQHMMKRCIANAPSMVMAVFVDTLLREVLAAGAAGAASADAGDRLGLMIGWVTGVAGVLFSGRLFLCCLPLVPFVYMYMSRPRSKPLGPGEEGVTASPKPKPSSGGVIVAGGGVGGLVLGACLKELGLPFSVRGFGLRGGDRGRHGCSC